MINKIITAFPKGSILVIWFIITTIIYLLMLMVTIPAVMKHSGGMNLPDMMPTGYDAAYIRSLFDTLGAAGRNLYLTRQLPLDLLFPGLFGITYAWMIAYFLNRLNLFRSPFRYLCLLPLLGGLFDYGENLSMIYLLLTYPDFGDQMITVSSVYTVLKSVFTTFTFITLPVLMLVGFRKRASGK